MKREERVERRFVFFWRFDQISFSLRFEGISYGYHGIGLYKTTFINCSI